MSAVSHSIQRAIERYDLELDTFDLGVLRELITLGRAVMMCRGNNGRHIYLLRYQDTTMKLVFCELSRQIITILPSSGRLRNRNQRRSGKMLRRNARLRKARRAAFSSSTCWAGA